MMTKSKPNPFQASVRKELRGWLNTLNGTKPDPIINKPSQDSEAWYRDRLAQQLKGQKEVQTPVGRIDVLTKTEIIELKNVKNWKAAIGQVKCYGQYYPNHRLRVHLFGEIRASQLLKIQSAYARENIRLTWE
jgi:hypothetical protein